MAAPFFFERKTMTNVLGNFNAELFASKALRWLTKRLGVSGLVNRHYEDERRSFQLGDTVSIRRPSTFTAETHVDGVGSSEQAINAQNVGISLNTHEEVKFALTEGDIAKGGIRLMNEHIGPAVNAVAEAIEASIYGLHTKIGSTVDVSGASTAAAHLTTVGKKLKQQKTPQNDGNLFYAIDPDTEASFLSDAIFNASNIVGGADNKAALVDGFVTKRFGMNIMSSQLAEIVRPDMVGTIGGGGDVAGAIDNVGGYPVNTTSMDIDTLTAVETAIAGEDTFTLAGDPTIYILTANLTLVAGAGTVAFFPGLQKPIADGAVVTFRVRTARENNSAGSRNNLAFHRDALALVMVPLSMEGNGIGAQIATVRDPESGLTLRLRKFYNGDSSKISLAVDALWGTQVLNSELATRAILAPST